MEKLANCKYIFFAIFFFVPNTILGQGNPLEIKVSIQLKNKTIEDIIKELHEISGVNFSYSTNYFPTDKRSVEIIDKTIKEALSITFANTHLSFKIVGNQIVIFPKSNKKNFTISGYIRDKESGESLIGANIYEPNLKTGTTTNLYGFFSFTLSTTDSIYILIKYVGYQSEIYHLKLDKDINLDVNLRSSIELKPVEIVEEKIEHKGDWSQKQPIEIPISQILSIPALLGEVDVLKTIQLLPGVQSGNEGNSGLYVRGGGQDQNLILLDGAPIYNASHLFGFFSIFNADAIKNVQLTKSGFPSRYGGRLSSVIDIIMKEGNMKKISGEGSLGLVASKLTLEGPIIKDKASFIVSARRTYIDILATPIIKKISGTTVGYYFYDLNAKFNYKVSKKDHIFLSLYLGNDLFYSQEKSSDVFEDRKIIYDEKIKFGWGNATSTLKWNKIISPKIFCNTSLIYSKYNLDIVALDSNKEIMPSATITKEYGMRYISGIEDWNGKIDFDFLPSPNHSIKFGAGNIYHKFNIGAIQFKGSNGGNTENTSIEGKPLYSHEMSAFIEDDWQLFSRSKTNIGVHFAGFSINNKYYKSFQPRIFSRYMLSENWTLKGSYATMMQYIHLLSNSSIGLPTDLWVPSTDIIKPQEAWQTSIGATRTMKFGKESYEFCFESYYKYMKNIIEYKSAADFIEPVDPSTDWQQQIEVGNGWSYGTELFFQKKTGITTGWIGYTISWTERQFENLNFGKKFPYRYDRRHDLSLVMSHQIKENINIAATWVYGTGNAITLPLIKYQGLSNNYNTMEDLYYYGERNGFRMRSYHRLDLGINFRKLTKWGERTINLSVYNAYSRKNPFFYEMSQDWDTGKFHLVQISFFPIIPAISYNFKF